MRYILSNILLLVVVVSTAQSASDFYKIGISKYSKKDYAGAAVEYTRAIGLNPKSSVLYNNRGLCYQKIEQWDKALADFTVALRFDNLNKEAHLNKGNLHKSLKELDLAVASYYNALDVDSTYSRVYPSLAFTLFTLKDYRSSAKYFTLAINSTSSPKATFYNGRGAAYSQMGQLDKAIKDYDLALDVNPKSYQSYINRGILRIRQKEYEDAVTDFTVAQSFAGFQGVGYYYRGLCRIDQLEAIRQSKDKHYVMDIKENKKLLDLACSDFKKAKTFSYGPSFETYQEYCVEKLDENMKVITMDTVTTSKANSIKPAEEVFTLTKNEILKLKEELKAEVLAELRDEMNLVKQENGSKDTLVLTIDTTRTKYVTDSLSTTSTNAHILENTPDANLEDSVNSDSFYLSLSKAMYNSIKFNIRTGKHLFLNNKIYNYSTYSNDSLDCYIENVRSDSLLDNITFYILKKYNTLLCHQEIEIIESGNGTDIELAPDTLDYPDNIQSDNVTFFQNGKLIYQGNTDKTFDDPEKLKKRLTKLQVYFKEN